jgi:hypothetical protein
MPASLPRGKVWHPVQNMQHLWRTNWQSDRFISQYYCFPPVSINPPLIQTHLYFETTLFRRTSGKIFPKSGNINEEKFLHCFSNAKDSYITVSWLLSQIFCQHLSTICSSKYNQQNATLCNILYYCQRSTCFRRFLRP